jgi:hypothetical protein
MASMWLEEKNGSSMCYGWIINLCEPVVHVPLPLSAQGLQQWYFEIGLVRVLHLQKLPKVGFFSSHFSSCYQTAGY